ncbi:MAG: NAD+ synthase [Planctomycetes bacterium]|nr:NAD+ synthase [Planctomycetota bacterium]
MGLRVALVQFNASVGDITGNIAAMRGFFANAEDLGVDLLVFPEMCVCGYPPEDLLHKEHFLEYSTESVRKLAKETGKMTVVAGFAERDGDKCYNSLAVMQGGKIEHVYRKCVLPNYGVFDEKRYFSAGNAPLVAEYGGINVAFTICEDIWDAQWLGEFLVGNSGPDLILNLSASPFHLGKVAQRREVVGNCTRNFGCPAGYCNLVGGQDELVFDGRSMFVGTDGEIICQGAAFEKDMIVADISAGKTPEIVNAGIAEKPGHLELGPVAEVYEALVLGSRDYVIKNGFKKVIIGLSGGIDSTLVAVIAVAALGRENVIGVTMPSKFNSAGTIGDAGLLAENLGIEFHTIPISECLTSFDQTLGVVEGWSDTGIAFENLQARIRGTLLMSLSNQLGCMVLTCGNKSETAVGYSTLYGDTAGGFAVIKDVPKTMVYRLCEYINEKFGREVVPVSVIERPPSAELKEGQADSDSLPDYDLLDAILKGYIEDDKSIDKLIEEGHDAGLVKKVVRLVDRNEYKRRQSPPGIKITPKAFGRDRRMPITNKY